MVWFFLKKCVHCLFHFSKIGGWSGDEAGGQCIKGKQAIKGWRERESDKKIEDILVLKRYIALCLNLLCSKR
jgi:hypothetical protein